jgi:hypothetical protein
MVRSIFSLLLLTTLAFGATAQDLPTPDAIIERYLKACGGQAAIANVQDMTLSLKADTPNGLAVIDVNTKQGHKFSQVVYLGGMEVSRTVSDGSKVTTIRGGRVTTALEGAAALRQLLSSSLFGEQFYAQYNVIRRTLARETLNGRDMYKVEFSTGNGEKWHDWFDVETGLRMQRTLYYRTANGLASSTSRFWEYKPVGGVVFPFMRSQTFGEYDATLAVSAIKVNRGVDDKLFRMP